MRYTPRQASTSYRVIERGETYALVEATVARALRHQIRVHFASIGHPLVGDALYGSAVEMGDASHGKRHALHASFIAFAGDHDASAFSVESPAPPELAAFIRA